MWPGTFVEAIQCRVLRALDLESTRAKQTYAPCLLQSRCPTMLIDIGRKSSTAGAPCMGVAPWVGFGLGVGEGACVGSGGDVGVLATVAVAAGAGFTAAVAEPQAARILLTKTMHSTAASVLV